MTDYNRTASIPCQESEYGTQTKNARKRKDISVRKDKNEGGSEGHITARVQFKKNYTVPLKVKVGPTWLKTVVWLRLHLLR